MARRVNGAALKAIRKALGIPQDVLAYRVDLSNAQISRVERGISGTTDEVIRKLAAELGVTVDAITHPVAVPA